jgi:hypothetical protein
MIAIVTSPIMLRYKPVCVPQASQAAGARR